MIASLPFRTATARGQEQSRAQAPAATEPGAADDTARDTSKTQVAKIDSATTEPEKSESATRDASEDGFTPTPAGPEGSARAGAEGARRAGIAGALLAALAFALAAVSVYGELWERGAADHVPVSRVDPDRRGFLQTIAIADVTFETWLVSRNAQTLASRPHHIFDAEHCAPAERSLTFGIPMITMGLLAIPTQLASGEAILTYNVSLVLLSLLGAGAMYWLVVSWTGVPAAGIVAGLFFGFQHARLESIMHPSVWDATWLVFALLFAERLLARGRWRDAAALGLAIALQVGASFYTLLGAFFAAPPFGLWLLLRERARRIPLAQLGAVAMAAGAAVLLVLGPYLGARTATGAMRRKSFYFASPSDYLPGELLFPGFALTLLVIVALCIPRKKLALRIVGDPRWVLLAGAGIVTAVAAGSSVRDAVGAAGFETLASLVPDFYALFASFLPGLEAIRVVERITQGAYVLLAILAGIGAAFVIRSAGRHAALAAVALVAIAGVEQVRPSVLGLERPYEWIYEKIRPSDAEIAFFEELERRGNSGPILEVPVSQQVLFTEPSKILLSAYHGRRTSSCFGSYFPEERRELSRMARRLPQRDAIESLQALGFTTVLWHHPRSSDPIAKRIRARRRPVPERLNGTDRMSAYALSDLLSAAPSKSSARELRAKRRARRGRGAP